MGSDKQMKRLAALVVLAISTIVYFFSVERTGSLWDCGEFVLAAYKLQVVHPPGAPLFLIVGRLFAALGDAVSDDPSTIAFAVNLMSGLCGAFTAMFVSMVAFIFGKHALVGRDGETSQADRIALGFTGLVAGLTTAFCTSIWFSAVEGEVYAMSTFFTAMTLWAMVEWYNLPNESTHDRWVVFALFSAGLSIGVHLLSLLTFPALTVLYYLKKRKEPTVKGTIISIGVGVFMIFFIQRFIIAGIPGLWATFERIAVNGLGLPFHSGLIPVILIIAGFMFYGLRYAHKHNNGLVQMAVVGIGLVILAFSVLAVVPIRSNAKPPVNMNAPDDAMRLLPYLNREQYGERPIMYGPHFNASPIRYESEERYGRVGDKYEVVDNKVTPIYARKDKMLFPRIAHNDANRKRIYKSRYGISGKGKPTMGQNIGFFLSYQVGWMYWRYFMWNFSGRQNGDQGYYSTDASSGNWLSGIKFLDEMRLHNMDELTDTMKNEKANNKYYLIPFILGLIGMFFHFKNDRKDFLTLLGLFIITGIGIIIYANQPPNEPRERDYVFVGSFFTYAIWVGMGVLAIYKLLKEKANLSGLTPAIIAGVLALSAPILMGTQNFDDHSRKNIRASRDYATNFLKALGQDAIIFTYGDNDTYPLWYVQEVENIRPDVRIINLSLIGVDWYINHQRNMYNESPAIKFTVSESSYRGRKRNQNILGGPRGNTNPMSTDQALAFVNQKHPVPTSGRALESYVPSKNLFIKVDKARALSSGWVAQNEANKIVDKIPFTFPDGKSYLTKGELAVLDIISSNVYDRPVYFSTTVLPSYLMGLQDYTEMDGIALKVVPIKTTSNRSLGIFGYGRNNLEGNYKAIMEDFEWGNFDKYDLNVDDSYSATQQAMRMCFMRLGSDLIQSGQKEKAADIANKYFEAFPHMNFAYSSVVVPFINILAQSGDKENAKKHMKILANEAAQSMKFYQSLDPSHLTGGMTFGQDRSRWAQTIQQINSILPQIGDEAFDKEIKEMLNPYQSMNTRN